MALFEECAQVRCKVGRFYIKKHLQAQLKLAVDV